MGPELPGLVCVRRVNESDGGDELYLALRVRDGAEVAVRVYARPVVTPRDRARFEREVSALRALAEDPHVLAIQDAGVSEAGQAYVVVEFCPAGSLHDHLAEVGRFTPAEVRRIGAKLAGALGHAHQRAIFHRNLKPANVLINGYGEPALTDFGFLALATSDGDFSPPSDARPDAFAAPEAYLPELMSAASDIYSLGATLYALLAGWEPRTVDPFAVTVDGDTLADPPKAPWMLMAVIRRAMALDPRHRYADAFGMQADLTNAA